MTYKFMEFYVSDRMMGGIERYVNSHIKPGDFLCAIICNDLREAVVKADEENMANLPAFVAYFYNEVPANCHGSKKKMEDWLAKRNSQ